MNIFAEKEASLFVSGKSPLSEVELFIQERRLDQDITAENPSRSTGAAHEKFVCRANVKQVDPLNRDASAGQDVSLLKGVNTLDNEKGSGEGLARKATFVDLDMNQKGVKCKEIDPCGCDSCSGGIPEPVRVRDPQQLQVYLKGQDQFRACIIRKQHSHSRFSISKDLFHALYLHCHLPTQFQDVLPYFGARDLEVEVAAPRLRFALTNSAQSSGPAGAANNTHGFECMYGLRYVELNNRGDPQRLYSLRQTAICNQEDPGLNLSTWVLVAPPSRVVQFLSEWADTMNMTGSSPFHIHIVLFEFAISSWRPYLVKLSEEVQEHGHMVLVADPLGNGPVPLTSCGDPQRLKRLRDEMGDTALALSTTRDALKRLTEAFMAHMPKINRPDELVKQHEDLHRQLLENTRELDWLLQQTDALHQKLLCTSQLVSSLTAQGNSQVLQELGEEAKRENCRIYELNKQSTQDAFTVKVLTIIILVYLPSTVVSNFFSTSFVDNQAEADGPRKLIILDNWWIFVAVSIPLTLMTLCAWWIFQAVQTRQRFPTCEKLIAKVTLAFSVRRMPFSDEENATAPSTSYGEADIFEENSSSSKA